MFCSATTLILTFNPASLAACMPLNTFSNRPHRVIFLNLSVLSVSSDTFIRVTPILASDSAKRSNWLPFVVRVSSFNFPDLRWRDIEEKNSIIFFLTKGSPPVIRNFSIPNLIKVVHTRSNSSRVRSSGFGRNVIFSDMQYRHLKSHLSVTDTLR